MKEDMFDLHTILRRNCRNWATVERFARNQAARSQESLKRCRFLKNFRVSCGCMHSASLIKLNFLGAMENYKRGQKEWCLGRSQLFSPFLVCTLFNS